ALMYHARLVALSCAGRIPWPATRVAAVYMIFMCVMDWILMQFPAQPKLAPIFNPVTHMVPLPFPLLLIFPALAIDFILRKAGESYRTSGTLAESAVDFLNPVGTRSTASQISREECDAVQRV